MNRTIPLCVLCGWLGPVAAAVSQSDSSVRVALSEADLIARGLDPKPVEVEQFGLSFHPPAPSVVTRDEASGRLSILIADAAREPAWRMRLQILRPDLEGATAESLARQHLQELTVNERPHRVMVDRSFQAVAVTGRQLVIEQQLDTGDHFVGGWLILPAGDHAFLVVSTVAPPDQHDALQRRFDASLATIDLTSRDVVVAERAARLDAGKAVLDSLTPERLRSLVGKAEYFRIYKPAAGASGEEEVGYSLVEVSEAPRGVLSQDRPEHLYSAAEQEEGLLVKVHARLVRDAARDLYVDSYQLYWLSWDRREETWSVLATIRQGDAAMTDLETGVRAPGPPAVLTVVRSDSRTNRREPKEWTVPQVYLSQAEHWLLGRLLPRDAGEAREMSYYFYQSGKVDLSLRTDRWLPAEGSRGWWTLETRYAADTQPIVSTYDSGGNFIRQSRPDGSVTEPSTREQIRRMWDEKRLKWVGQ
jgi:hypothetical protein